MFQALPDHDPKRRQPDLTLARNRLGYAPKVAWREGLTATISYFHQVLGARSTLSHDDECRVMR